MAVEKVSKYESVLESLEVLTSPSCFLVAPSYDTVLPEPEIWQSAGSGAVRQPE